jgi:hypothetical protein
MTPDSEPWATKLAEALCAPAPSAAALEEARGRLAGGDGAALFDAMFARQTGDEGASRVSALMKVLERLAGVAADVGGCLMARLHPLAARHEAHSTYDAIELWMFDATSPAVADALTRLASEGVRLRLQERCRAWAGAIRSRRG